LETANQALQKSIINLEKSNADLKYFSKIIAHDLNHPLVTILGYSNIILKANKKKLNEDEMRKLQTIINDSTEMSDTINLLLQNSFPRLERDQVNLGK
jgi:two-component system CheB/CheR fusion protein